MCGSFPVVVEQRIFVALGEESREAAAEQGEMCGQTQQRQRVRERWREEEDLEVLLLACNLLLEVPKIVFLHSSSTYIHV